MPSKKTIENKSSRKSKVSSINKKYIEAVGRRKEAVARVRLIKDTPAIVINGKDLKEYFPILAYQDVIMAPLRLTNTSNSFLISVQVKGGGMTGQAEAIRLGISRCLLKVQSSYRSLLKKEGFLTRDSRIVERKKYGRKKARKKAQWSKR